MPQIKIRGVKTEKTLDISKDLVDELHKIIDRPRDYITIELIHSTFIANGQITEGYPYVEVGWFDRGQEIQDKVAKSITVLFKISAMKV